ncbi:MAG: Uma2 family endonuclease [Acidimicrobiales bacterium]
MTTTATGPTRHAFTVEQWHRLGEVGLFGEDSRAELLDGEVVDMSPIGALHALCVKRLIRMFSMLVGEAAIISAQDPVVLDDRSEPQPDLALLRPPLERYAAAHPGPEDIFLVVEVADTSLVWDRDHKAPLYGRAGVGECWVVDLSTGEVLVLGRPSPDGYLTSRRARRGERLDVPGLPGTMVAVDDVLGPA